MDSSNVQKIITEKMKELTSRSRTTALFAGILVIFTVVLVIFYIRRQQTKPSINKTHMDKQLERYPPKMSSLNTDDAQYQYNLRDYNILTSYNSCCGGNYMNDYVSKNALETVIKMGARCLDFEIYMVDNEPVVGASTKQSVFIKETYNYIPFSTAMQMVEEMAFSNRYAPNHREPLLIQLRVKSNMIETYDKMAKILNDTLSPYMLGPEYGYENHGNNMSGKPLKDFMERAIIILDVGNPIYRESKIEELVNIGANSRFMRSERTQDVVYTHNHREVIDYNKKHLSYCMPDLTSEENSHMDVKWKYGVQMIGTQFQRDDVGFKYIYSKFQNKHGFILKNKNLRFIPNTISQPKKQTENVSYQPRQLKGKGYSITV